MGINQIGFGVKSTANPVVPISLASGGVYNIPSGQFSVIPGKYSFLQVFDPITSIWRIPQTAAQNAPAVVSSDGYNFRLANLTGTMVGASVTTASSALTNGIYYPAGYPIAGNPSAQVQAGVASVPSVVMSAGGGTVLAKCNIIVGGCNSTAPTITSGGSGYTRPPSLIFSAPPAGGVPMTGYVATITAGAVAAVTIDNQGAGYTTVPTCTVVNHPLDTTGSGCVITCAALAGSGTVTAITVVDNGAGMNAVPTFTFSPTGPAATAIMCFTITTGVAQTSADHMATGNIGFALGGTATAQSVNTNPAITTGLFQPRLATTALNTTAGGGITFLDGGLHQIIPTGIAYAILSDGTITSASTKVAQTVGGAANDISYLIPL